MIEFLLGRVVPWMVGLLSLSFALVSWSYLIFAAFSGVIRRSFGHEPQWIQFVHSPVAFTLSALTYLGVSLFFTYGAWDLIAAAFRSLLQAALKLPSIRRVAGSRLLRTLQAQWNAARSRPVIFIRIDHHKLSGWEPGRQMASGTQTTLMWSSAESLIADPRTARSCFKSLFAELQKVKTWNRAPIVVIQVVCESRVDTRARDLSPLMQAATKAGAAQVWALPGSPALTDDQLGDLARSLGST
jgi:hypothetical protein